MFGALISDGGECLLAVIRSDYHDPDSVPHSSFVTRHPLEGCVPSRSRREGSLATTFCLRSEGLFVWHGGIERRKCNQVTYTQMAATHHLQAEYHLFVARWALQIRGLWHCSSTAAYADDTWTYIPSSPNATFCSKAWLTFIAVVFSYRSLWAWLQWSAADIVQREPLVFDLIMYLASQSRIALNFAALCSSPLIAQNGSWTFENN